MAYWRYPTYNAVRFSFTAFFGFVLGTTFWRIGQDRCGPGNPQSPASLRSSEAVLVCALVSAVLTAGRLTADCKLRLSAGLSLQIGGGPQALYPPGPLGVRNPSAADS